MDEIRAKTADIAGILVEVTAPRAGPPTGKPIQVQLVGARSGHAAGRGQESRRHAGASMPEIRDLDDGLPLPGIDWKIKVDKAEAAKYGASLGTVGTAVQLVTNGVKVTEYRPSDNDKAVDIIVRFPEDRRSLDQIDELRVQTHGRLRADRQFRRAAWPPPRVGHINRVDGNRVMTVSANIADGVQTAVVQQEITDELATRPISATA